jgi:hypothetical protein
LSKITLGQRRKLYGVPRNEEHTTETPFGRPKETSIRHCSGRVLETAAKRPHEAIKSLGSNKKERDEYVLDGMEVVFNYEDFSKRMTLFFKKTWGDNI